MLTFLSVAFSIYGAMHFYAISKVWLALPHSAWLGFTLALVGLTMTLSPFILWQLTRQNWHGTSLISWMVYLWMGFVFLFCCTALLLDLGLGLAALFGLKWPLNESMYLLAIGLLTLSLMSSVITMLRNIQPDIVVATGDIVDGQGDELNALARRQGANKPIQTSCARATRIKF